MKKIMFYTRQRINNKIQAVPVQGYTDGRYHYYKDKFGRWFAIVPEVGLSPSGCCVYTRKLAQAIIHEHAPKIAEFMRTRGAEESAYFAKLIDEAKQNIV